MKKIILAEPLQSILEKEDSVLHRADVQLFTAATNDELLALHHAEKVNLIITQLDMPGISSEQLCSSIRKDGVLRQVSLIICCSDSAADHERVSRCNPNAALTCPIDPAQFMVKIQQHLDIPWRGAYRVLVRVNGEGQNKEKAFFCRSENISVKGLLLETERTLEKNDRVACSFCLPDSKQLITHGEVVRVLKTSSQSRLNRYGIKFSQLAPEVRSAIESFIERKRQQSFYKPSF